MKTLIWLLLPVCVFSQDKTQEFQLKGQFPRPENIDKVFLSYFNTENWGGGTIDDSSTVSNGKFLFKGKIAEPWPATISVRYKSRNAGTKPVRQSLYFMLVPGESTIRIKDSLNDAELTSSVETEFMYYQSLENDFRELIDPYGQRWANEKDEAVKAKYLRQIDSVSATKANAVFQKFVSKYPNSALKLYVLGRSVRGNISDPVKADALLNSLDPKMQQWPSAVQLKSRIEGAKKTAIGSMAAVFTLPDTSGNPVSLADFKGKYLLVDFWASWCGPCRGENPNLVKAYHQYKDKGFTILGVSLDMPGEKDKWLAAIHKDQLAWTQVSDLKSWNCEAAKLYGVNGIPFNLLLDPQGKIIAKDIRGKDLQDTLQQLFNK